MNRLNTYVINSLKMLITTSTVFGLALMVGCATPEYNYRPAVTEISEPPIGSVNVAYVGDNLLRQGTYQDHQAIRLDDEVKVGTIGNYRFTAGHYLKEGEEGDVEYYNPSNIEGSGEVIRGSITDPFQAILAYKTKPTLCGITIFNGKVCKNNVDFVRFLQPILATDSFQQTLIYSGQVGDKLNIGYREFSGNAARPAFNNDVEYDLSESLVIGYKGAKLEVIEATNQFIKYRVVRNFNRAGEAAPLPEDADHATSNQPTVVYGTCFAVSDSEVLTSHHVVDGASIVTVVFQDGVEKGAIVSEQSQSTDLALLRINGKTPTALALAPVRSLTVGEEVFTVGYPVTSILGTDAKFTEGSVSALSGIQNDASYFQMSVPVQPGNSGGPVLNMRGEVVGIVAATAAIEAFYATSGSLPQNINWASKSDYARLLFDAPNIEKRAKDRAEAIDMAYSAICKVTAVSN